MNQDRLDELEDRVEHLEEGNGWHEWSKYVLKKLDEVVSDGKETRKELCGKMDVIVNENTIAHRELHRKLDVQRNFCASRPIECAKSFLPSKTFNWLIIALVALFAASFTLAATALKQNVEQDKRIELHEKVVPSEKLEDKVHDLIPHE